MDLNSYIKALLKAYHLKLVFKKMKGKGYIVNVPKRDFDFIFINSQLEGLELAEVILHEIGHARNCYRVIGNGFDVDCFTRIKDEHEANDYMIEKMVAEEASLNYNIEAVNYVDFAKSLGTNDYDKVKAELAKYIVKE